MKINLVPLALLVPLWTCGCDRKTSSASPAATSPSAASQPASIEFNHTLFHTRGQVVEPVFTKSGQGFAVVLDHENIPGLMDAMRMEYRLADPADAARLKPGEKIAFDIAEQPEGDFAVTHVAALPVDTVLKLAPPSPPRTEPK